MALNPKFTNLAANTEADALAALMNSGYIRIYSGTQPATADTAIGAQVLLAELRFNATAFGAAVAGVITANAVVSDAAADATDTAAWFRALKSDGTTAVLDGSVGTATADLVVNSVDFVINVPVAITALTITVSKG